MLLDDGCVFLPAAGRYGGSWLGGGGDGYYWSSTSYDSSQAYYLNSYNGAVSVIKSAKSYYLPVLLVRE